MEFKKVTNKDKGFEHLQDGITYLCAIVAIDDSGPITGSGKSNMYATTHGNLASGLMMDKKPLMVSVNAFTNIPKHLRVAPPVVAS
jgi:hypothetical protein